MPTQFRGDFSKLPMLEPTSDSTVSQNVTWSDYEAAIRTRGSNSLPRFNYYQGTLETASPGPKHSKQVRRLASLVETVAEIWAIDAENLGSTTFKRVDLACGLEPDCCFYMDSFDSIADSDDINLETGDPPPDLVLEIQPVGVSMPKLPLYELIGVPEVWQIDSDGFLHIFARKGNALVESLTSAAFCKITAEDLNKLLDYGEAASRVEWLKRVREWAFNA